MQRMVSNDGFNQDLLSLIPLDARRVIEVGCSTGALAGRYLDLNPSCDYVGIEPNPQSAARASERCSRVLNCAVEDLQDEDFQALLPADCWVFGDVLEHLTDPWSVLQRIRAAMAPEACLVACIPNAQHWSVQARLVTGAFRYEDAGLMDRTHLRWFTRTTIAEMFDHLGFRIVGARARIFDEPKRDRVLAGIRAFAQALGVDPEVAARDATPMQWVVHAVPTELGK